MIQVTNGNACALPLADESIHMICTSPPYYGKVDYGLPPTHWRGSELCRHEYKDNLCQHCGRGLACLGLEPTPDLFIAHLVEVGRELRRVLRPDGTLWLNMGDSYISAKSRRSSSAQTMDGKEMGQPTKRNRPELKGHDVYKDKDLALIPAMLAIAYRRQGWYVRSWITWEKSNGRPESMKDRPTRNDETLFIFSKSPRYFYDSEAVREPQSVESVLRQLRGRSENHKRSNGTPGHIPHSMLKGKEPAQDGAVIDTRGRNLRTVWRMPTAQYKGSHFAVMPPVMAERAILLGSPPCVCSECGSPYLRTTEKQIKPMTVAGKNVKALTTLTKGWRAACNCEAKTSKAIILDPFMGSGTILEIARKLGRSGIGVDLSMPFGGLSMQRLGLDLLLPQPPAPPHDLDFGLFSYQTQKEAV